MTETTNGKQGRFKPGQSGNPAGRPPGARHKTTLAIEALLDGEAEALTRKAIEMALAGDVTAIRLCMERVAPPRKGRTVDFPLPAFEKVEDTVTTIGAVLQAVSEGRLTPEEGAAVAGLIEMKRKSIETVELEARLAALEERSK
ncbi:DUF5681 domain-containing protein [Asticcacaulis sp.]|uniref:DUF5681 domain-containing protein n=1 Tax=Asticcacaulis sp. TaxID=1872648 RepID=UPI0031E14D7B